jgi:hypothetical protein
MKRLHVWLKICCIYIFILIKSDVDAFDWKLYLQHNPELEQLGVDTYDEAFKHYLTYGINQNRVSASHLPPSSNFDWHYYVEHNNITCTNEADALRHYRSVGAALQLPYCKTYTFLIALHLYNLELMDEFIEHINCFMRLNHFNNFIIMINIPVDTNITKFFSTKAHKTKMVSFLLDEAPLPVDCLIHDMFHLKNDRNFRKLNSIVRYFLKGLQGDPAHIQFLFSPNRGRDIGGFFLQLDQIFKQNLQYDYLVKIHSKTSPHAHALWRTLNTSLLRIHINPLLHEYDCIYSNRLYYDLYDKYKAHEADPHEPARDNNFTNICQLLNFFTLPPRNFTFCAGTMFIVPKRFVDFFRQYDLLCLFNMLNDEQSFNHALDGRIEHAFERFFGYLIDYLGLKTYCLDYQPLPK